MKAQLSAAGAARSSAATFLSNCRMTGTSGASTWPWATASTLVRLTTSSRPPNAWIFTRSESRHYPTCARLDQDGIQGLDKICELARQNAEICAIIAGDLHHYSHYISDDPRRSPPMHVIVSGGGGAFAHPTHDQRNKIEIEAPVVTRELLNVGHELLLDARRRTIHSAPRPSTLPGRSAGSSPSRTSGFPSTTAVLLPSSASFTSSMPGCSIRRLRQRWQPGLSSRLQTRQQSPGPRRRIPFFFMLLGLWVGLVLYVDARLSNRFLKWLNGTVKVVLGSVHFLFHIMALLYVAAITTALTTKVFNPVIGTIVLYSKVFLEEFSDTGNRKRRSRAGLPRRYRLGQSGNMAVCHGSAGCLLYRRNGAVARCNFHPDRWDYRSIHIRLLLGYHVGALRHAPGCLQCTWHQRLQELPAHEIRGKQADDLSHRAPPRARSARLAPL